MHDEHESGIDYPYPGAIDEATQRRVGRSLWIVLTVVALATWAALYLVA